MKGITINVLVLLSMAFTWSLASPQPYPADNPATTETPSPTIPTLSGASSATNAGAELSGIATQAGAAASALVSEFPNLLSVAGNQVGNILEWASALGLLGGDGSSGYPIATSSAEASSALETLASQATQSSEPTTSSADENSNSGGSSEAAATSASSEGAGAVLKPGLGHTSGRWMNAEAGVIAGGVAVVAAIL